MESSLRAYFRGADGSKFHYYPDGDLGLPPHAHFLDAMVLVLAKSWAPLEGGLFVCIVSVTFPTVSFVRSFSFALGVGSGLPKISAVSHLCLI